MGKAPLLCLQSPQQPVSLNTSRVTPTCPSSCRRSLCRGEALYKCWKTVRFPVAMN